MLTTALTLCAALVPATAAVAPDEPDLIVGGAGISGLSAALEAARGGARVRIGAVLGDP
jgi:ribulose 1,5-bisphosphate synthetase/thiazole synthase